MNLSQLFTHNYEYLNTVAKRITRCKDYRMAPELLSTTYLAVHEKSNYPTDNEQFVKWFSKFMKNTFMFRDSGFNQVHRPKENLVLGEPNLDLTDEDALKEVELAAEETNEFTKEIIEISSSLGKVPTLKYLEAVEFKRSLPMHENILFELYFEKELSTRQIATLYSSEVHIMNYQSVNIMVNKIKTKIKQYKWKQ